MLILMDFKHTNGRVILNVTEQDKEGIIAASTYPDHKYRYYLADNHLSGDKRNVAVKYIYPIISGQEKKVEDDWCSIVLLE